MITELLGGFGLFLLGMVLMTEGLKSAAGEALRGVLVRLTGGRARAFAAGAGLTALLQSSSATVLMTIGFVSAGLIGFSSAVAVVFGANVGTTSTGWIVALLGLKLSVGSIALPAVAVGALLRLLGRGRLEGVGLAIAGFGLIFTGIDLLQSGMQAVSGRFDPASFPGGTFGGNLLLVGVGAAMTVVMQSSSAAVATTLTALHSGAIGLEQAAALVVGQNIGTTVTAAIAGLGASVFARRTAVAHILFNVLTGLVAFALIPFLLRMEARLWPGSATPEPALLVAAFHTVFNLIGVALLAPVFGRYVALVARMVPDRAPDFARHLDPNVARIPVVAAEVARRTVMEIAANLARLFVEALERPGRSKLASEILERADTALDETRRFVSRAGASGDGGNAAHYLAVLHAIDHLERLVERLRVLPDAPAIGIEYRAAAALVPTGLAPAVRWLDDPAAPDPLESTEALSLGIAGRRRRQRADNLRAAAEGELDPDVALRHLDAMRWLDASVYHVWRALHHLVTRESDTEAEARD
ncbi:MAG TPA: Na/Pi symporter [Gemmatimonadaceae bacterium]|nr:Na/Pi symporter [Gemmatimonadaceae bacterium]